MRSERVRIFVLCVIFLISSSVNSQRCNGGASCVVITECSGLYSRLQGGNASPELRALLRGLHCGFDNNMPKICCPPEFNSVTADSRNSESKLELLPNDKNCGIQNNDRIVGGVEADIDEHPWMALLRYDKPFGWGFHCGGVLISNKYVLTAAHCVVKGKDLPPNWQLSQVRLGEWKTSTENDCVKGDCANPVQDIPVETIIAHEGYQPLDTNQHNDIALLRLTSPAQISDFVKPICLPLSRELRQSSFNGFDMEVAGWGSTESSLESDVKLKVRVPIVETNQCARTYTQVNRSVDNTQICAGGVKGRDSCRGDSGGSLMGQGPTANNWMAIGVVSYGPTPCGTAGWPGVYTRVGAYVDWILSKLEP